MDLKLQNTIVTYDSTAERYAEETEGMLCKEQLDRFIDYIGKNSKQVMDLGCGPARDSEYFYDAGLKVVGIDLSSKFLAMARERVPGGYFFNLDILGPLSKVWHSKFDGVWASASLVHVPQDNLFYIVSQVRDVLKSQGIFYASVKEGEGCETRVSRKYGFSRGGEKFWQYFTEREFSKTLLSVGFDILDFSRNENKFEPEHPWMEFFARKRK